MNPSGSPGRTSALSNCHPQKVQWHQPKAEVFQMCGSHLELLHPGGEVVLDGKYSKQEGPAQVSQELWRICFSLCPVWSRSSFHSSFFTAGFVLAKLAWVWNSFLICCWGFHGGSVFLGMGPSLRSCTLLSEMLNSSLALSSRVPNSKRSLYAKLAQVVSNTVLQWRWYLRHFVTWCLSLSFRALLSH